MQKKGQVIFFVVLGLLLLGVYYLKRNQGYVWYEWAPEYAYHYKSEQPFGLSALYKLTENLYKDAGVVCIEKNIIYEMPLATAPSSSYLMISHNMHFTLKERDHLLKWVENGGTALLSSKEMDFDLLHKPTSEALLKESEHQETIFDDDLLVPPLDSSAEVIEHDSIATEHTENAEGLGELLNVLDSLSDLRGTNRNGSLGIKDTIADMAFVVDQNGALGTKYTFTCPVQNVAIEYYWKGINRFFLDSNRTVIIEKLGFIEDSILNFVGIDYGKGRFLFHSNPIVFANYHLLRQDGKAYCTGMLSYLKPKGTLYWDESNKTSDLVNPENGHARSKNILATLLKEKALAYAWYLLMLMVLVYLFFGAKRRQRTIPILPQTTNTSLEFVETISDLHFAQRDYDKLSRQKMRHFLSHLRERYGVTIPVVNDNGQLGVEKQHIDRIAALSEVPKELIENIFNKYQNITTFEPIEQTLLDFHFTIEQFMKWKKT